MSLSPDQRAQRRTMVTASVAASILGVHPYQPPLAAWRWLVHGVEQSETSHMRWGNLLEPVIRDDYAARHGLRVIVPGTLVSADDDRHGATPDGIAYRRDGVLVEGLEIKVHGSYARHGYGEPGTDDVPTHEYVQCVWSQMVTGIERWRLVASVGGPPVEYVIERDIDLERELAAAVNEWWDDFVVTRRPPPPDGSDGYADWIAQIRPQHGPAFPESRLYGRIADLRAATAAAAEATAQQRLATQRVQCLMGAATAVALDDGKQVTWRADRNGTRVFRVPSHWREKPSGPAQLTRKSLAVAARYARSRSPLSPLLRARRP